MRITITPTLLVVADYDGDELVTPIYPHEYRRLVEMGYPLIAKKEFSWDGFDMVDVSLYQHYTDRDLYKHINTIIRTAFKDVRRTLR